MAIRLDNFEQAVEPMIVQRGSRYFRGGRVLQCTDEDGEVEAVVQGSELYKVSMFVDADGELHEHRCTCPYDWGSICKHEVAVLYYLRERRRANGERRKAKEAVSQMIAQMKAPKKALWEEVIEGLMEPLQPKTKDADKAMPQSHFSERMMYVIEPFRDGRKIHPHRQKWLKSGKWGRPTSASIKTFIEQGYTFMDAKDREISGHLNSVIQGQYFYSYFDSLLEHLENYLPFLVDSDKVLFRERGRKTFQRVEVRQERAYLNIDRQGKKLVFSSNVSLDKKGTSVPTPCVIAEDSTHYIVVELTPYEQKLYSMLLRLGSMPEEAESRLQELLMAVGNLVEVHSDLIEGGSTLERVAGESTVVLRVTPKKGAFIVDCCVQPLQGGRMRFFPAEGKATIYDTREGTRYQVERDLEEEARRLEELKAFCADELGFVPGPEPRTIELEELLPLMAFVAEHKSDFAVEWPDGAKINLKEPVHAESYAMGLRTKENWFEVEGTLQIDEQTILSAAELLKLMQGKMVGKRFVRLGQTEFLALNERLAKELSRVQQLARVRNNKVIIPRFEVGLLGEMLSHPESILREDQGVAELLRKIDEAARMPIEVPQDLQAQLRDYQEEGYRWMTRLAAWGAGACLADDMGLGKTVQTIAVLLNRANHGPSLVVAPASVVYNWQSEIERFAPTLKVHILHVMSPDGTGERVSVANRGKGEITTRRELIRSLSERDVLLTTYGLLVREQKALTDKRWNVVCLDEAHTIKNRQTKMSQAAMGLRADFRIALTGTPLQNYLSELWNLFQFINPGLLGSFEAFSHDFITPIEVGHDKERQQTLRQILQPFLLRRTKAEVIDELPEKTEIIRRVELSDGERVAYEAMRIEAQMQVAQASKVDVNVLASITRLRQAADSDSKLEDFTALLTQIITGGNRVLVFSQFTTFLSAAQHALGEDVCTFYLDGSTPIAKRKQLVERFQKGEAQVFFISLKAGGLGLNLTEANYVIHLDPWWNPAIEQQATDRAYRIGQRRNVTVYHLIAADTIEEKILRLHKTKRDLADALLQDQNTAQTLTLDDLKMLLDKK